MTLKSELLSYGLLRHTVTNRSANQITIQFVSGSSNLKVLESRIQIRILEL